MIILLYLCYWHYIVTPASGFPVIYVINFFILILSVVNIYKYFKIKSYKEIIRQQNLEEDFRSFADSINHCTGHADKKLYTYRHFFDFMRVKGKYDQKKSIPKQK